MSEQPRIDAEIVRTEHKGGRAKGSPMSPEEREQRRLAGIARGAAARARKATGQPRYGGRLTPAQLERERIMRESNRTVELARIRIREAANEAAKLLERALTEPVDPTQIAAARSLLAKAGIADLAAVEHRGEPPVVVSLGGMDLYPKPDADADGIERDEDAEGE